MLLIRNTLDVPTCSREAPSKGLLGAVDRPWAGEWRPKPFSRLGTAFFFRLQVFQIPPRIVLKSGKDLLQILVPEVAIDSLS